MPDGSPLPAAPRTPARFLLPAGSSVEFVQLWLAAAKPGDVLVYHRGHLAADRQKVGRLGEIADLLGRAAGRHQVNLTQERVPDSATRAYLATKR